MKYFQELLNEGGNGTHVSGLENEKNKKERGSVEEPKKKEIIERKNNKKN